ncbi:tetratricopeptide (TPR) repeat protein [Rhodanobacter sp. ANJX3]|uniref:tetratricopeptide repeat-containing sulfotransferase family protein n=1 Tax=unclassified Rhodanobacter TaxID=2621553 RepID=UPI0015CA2395|nr:MULTISPECIES: tetratricopeptide repeat-containing sulfotransferase family protein [unclassified Rhodanobacter]MBB5359398.1 tetratricopeptide (TPR) repeat protein [Rhodanobacter sp. ANJX3]NYE29849.1 tetratricopeptide (TPR) repeat protein [Rhodanobacter sp. K2T2]
MPDRAHPSSDSPPAADVSPSRQDIERLTQLVGKQQHAQAQSLARQLIARFPTHGFAWKALGTSLKSQGRIADAVVAERQAASLLPHDASAHHNLGNGLMLLDDPAQAADSYRRALAIRPDYFEAHFNLGSALEAQGEWSDAIDSYRHALAIRPGFIDAHARLGHVLIAAGRHVDAIAHFQQVLAARPDDALSHHSLGIVYRSEGRLSEAEARYRRALAIDPNYVEALINLGNVLGAQGRLADAESSYRQALVLDDGYAETHFNLGNILRDQNRQLDAEQSYRRALKIAPRHVKALNNLGLCLKRQGRLDEARECFEAAIETRPDFVQSHCNLSPLKTYAIDDPHLALFEGQLHQVPSLPKTGQSSYWFALGKMREDVGRYDDAFAAYAQGNRCQHELFPHDEAREVALVQRLQSVFSEAFFANRAKPTHADKAPIFIVGMPRSGTSLIEQILSTYPGVYGAGELTDLDNVVHLVEKSLGERKASYPDIIVNLSADELRRLGEIYIDRVWRHTPQAERITDKMPANFLHIGMIHLMLPQARIIHAMRDPMDSCFSCYSRLFAGNNLDFAYRLETVGRYYVRYIQMMRHWQRVLPLGTVLDVRYEDMVTDTEGQARRLLAYLGLPWDERCLAFHQNQRVVRTASVAQVRKPIYRSSVARWKHFEAHLAPLLEIVKDYR